MATTTPERTRPVPRPRSGDSRPHGTTGGAQPRTGLSALLHRPLTTYYLLASATAMLLGLGLVMVLSASSVPSYRDFGSSFAVFKKQAMWFAVGLPMLWIASRLPVRAWRALAYPALLLGIALLVLVPIIGVEVNGNQNWLEFGGPFRIQPSEPAKLALVLWGADLLTRKQRLLQQWKHLLVPLVPVSCVFVGLVLMGDDLGTALILLAVALGVLFFAGAPLRVFGWLLVAGGVLVGYLASTHQRRMARLTTWLDPGADLDNAGYQALHSRYALAQGGWWGRNLGAGREKWGALPEAHNDMIFAVIGEELGLVGTVAVLGLFAVLCYAILRVALRTNDCFVRLAASGVFVWIAAQTVVNVGSVTGVLPVVGLPLPLVSYGGSALLPTMIALGMLLSFARREPGAAAALAARRRWTPWGRLRQRRAATPVSRGR